MLSMEDLADDAIWRDYEKASQAHRRAMKERLDAELDVTRRCSEESLQRWDGTHRDEEKCYEELKALQRAVWAKYH